MKPYEIVIASKTTKRFSDSLDVKYIFWSFSCHCHNQQILGEGEKPQRITSTKEGRKALGDFEASA